MDVTGIHLGLDGDHVVVKAEIGGRFVEVIREFSGNYFSHYVTDGGMKAAAIRQSVSKDQSSLNLGPYKPGHDKADHDCHPECNCIRLPVAGGFQ